PGPGPDGQRARPAFPQTRLARPTPAPLLRKLAAERPSPKDHPPWGVLAAEYAGAGRSSRVAVKARAQAQYIQRVPQCRHGPGGSSEACALRNASYSGPLQISEIGRSKALPRTSPS